MKTLWYAIVAICATGCATPTPVMPGYGYSNGYQCYRRENTAAGFVFAEGYPDYHGGYASLTMGWNAETQGAESWQAQAYWTSGPKAISPPGWLSLHRSVRELPPMGSKIRLQLSTGETLEREFVDKKTWQQWNNFKAAGYGGLIHIQEPRLVEAFSKASWADIGVYDPSGALIATSRIDLSELPAALDTMRRLGDQVMSDIADSDHRCGEIHIELK
jgi:hypothetical protein